MPTLPSMFMFHGPTGSEQVGIVPRKKHDIMQAQRAAKAARKGRSPTNRPITKIERVMISRGLLK